MPNGGGSTASPVPLEQIRDWLNRTDDPDVHRRLTALVLAIEEATDDGQAVAAGAAPAHPTLPARREQSPSPGGKHV